MNTYGRNSPLVFIGVSINTYLRCIPAWIILWIQVNKIIALCVRMRMDSVVLLVYWWWHLPSLLENLVERILICPSRFQRVGRSNAKQQITYLIKCVISCYGTEYCRACYSFREVSIWNSCFVQQHCFFLDHSTIHIIFCFYIIFHAFTVIASNLSTPMAYPDLKQWITNNITLASP